LAPEKSSEKGIIEIKNDKFDYPDKKLPEIYK
jgi:hypothetical protein